MCGYVRSHRKIKERYTEELMEKQTIEIRKIKDGLFLERKDEVAIEQDFEIRLQN